MAILLPQSVSMIEVSDLSFTYRGQTMLTFPDFTIGKGEHCLLVGESGSGKTTLLHLLGGLLRGYAGKLKIEGTELNSLPETALDKFRGKKIGFIFQKNHLVHALNVEKNLWLSPYLAKVPVDESRVAKILNDLNLTGKRKNRVAELSQGQAQRVAIARAVLHQPALILADEPTSALDDRNCDRVTNLLLEMAAQNGATLVVATHDQRLKQKIKRQIQVVQQTFV
jgi:ABC-type lipoprotein export system ATPase subunit